MAPSKVVEGSVGGGRSEQIVSCPEVVLLRTILLLLLCREAIVPITEFVLLVEICGRMVKD